MLAALSVLIVSILAYSIVSSMAAADKLSVLQAQMDHLSSCNTKSYRDSTLKMVDSQPAVALLYDSREHRIFEGSDIAVKNSTFYVVFDSLDAIGRFRPFSVSRDKDNMLIGPNGG